MFLSVLSEYSLRHKRRGKSSDFFGETNFSTREIVIWPNRSKWGKIDTLVHELFHAALGPEASERQVRLLTRAVMAWLRGRETPESLRLTLRRVVRDWKRREERRQ